MRRLFNKKYLRLTYFKCLRSATAAAIRLEMILGIAGGKLLVLSVRRDALWCSICLCCHRKNSPGRHCTSTRRERKKRQFGRSCFSRCVLYWVSCAGVWEGAQSHNYPWAWKSQAVALKRNVYVGNKIPTQVHNSFRDGRQCSWSVPV